MQLKRRVALNGVFLDTVDSRIVITSVEPAEGKENISAVDAATGYGQRITGNRRSTLDMVVKFALLERGSSTDGMQARAELLEKVNAWAAPGGYLTINYKPDRRLRVILAQAAGEGSLWEFNKEFSLTFRAYGIPFWETENQISQWVGSGSASDRSVLTYEGSAKTQADVELKNISGMNIATATVRVGTYTMYFSNIGLGADEALVVDHTADGLVRIRIRSAGGSYRSVMALRGTNSADDFWILPGGNEFAFTIQRACRMTVSWRARYL